MNSQDSKSEMPQQRQVNPQTTAPGKDLDHSRGSNHGFANGDEPTWAPPESQPEPRPIEPILTPTTSNQSPNTISPA